MQNSNQLPVYTVPGTDGNPDLYFLRSFTQGPDTPISQEQYDGITGAIDTAEASNTSSNPSSASASLAAEHAAIDPASPDFQGTPAVNADVAGSAAAPVSKPPIDPGNPETPVSTGPIVQSDFGDKVTPSQGTLAFTDSAQSGTVAGGPDINSTVPDPAVSSGDNSAGAQVHASDPASSGVADPNVSPSTDGSGSTNSSGSLPEGNPTAQASSAGTGSSDPNGENTPSSQQNGSTSSGETSSDPNVQASGDQSSASGSQTTGQKAGSDPNAQGSTTAGTSSGVPEAHVDPTDANVVAGQPLPPSVAPNTEIIDPVTGATPDLTEHPVVTADLQDPAIVQIPPANISADEHISWFAKEKQRILDFFKSEEADVDKLQDPDAGNA